MGLGAVFLSFLSGVAICSVIAMLVAASFALSFGSSCVCVQLKVSMCFMSL